MKSFLISFLVCTFGASSWAMPAEALKAPKGGIYLGSLEMWSEWFPMDAEPDLAQVCKEVMAYYNQLNFPRGYWGKLASAQPIGYSLRSNPAGNTQKRFYCHLRVKKFALEGED